MEISGANDERSYEFISFLKQLGSACTPTTGILPKLKDSLLSHNRNINLRFHRFSKFQKLHMETSIITRNLDKSINEGRHTHDR
jgi:hypothetical protein